jgi:hypothetical protein
MSDLRATAIADKEVRKGASDARQAFSQLEVGIWVMARKGLSTLNTSSCLNQLQQLLQNCGCIARGTRKLTISHGSWPVCSRDEWERHPLLFGGNDRWNAIQTSDMERVDIAFAEYKMFIAEEESRRFSEDVDIIANLLNLLPNLQTIVISHMRGYSWHPSRNTKYHILQKKIWMAPFMDNKVAQAVQTFLLAFSKKFINIACLKIYGTLNPGDLHLSPSDSQFPSIHKLCVMSFQIVENEDVIQKFLQAFPNLVDLSVKFQGWESSIPNVIGKLFWRHLKTLRLDDLWASEEDIFGLFERHQRTLEQFKLGDTTIIQGSWRSLFTRMRSLRIQAQIVVHGELYGRRSRDTITVHHHGAAARLTSFMQDQDAPWPFGVF